MSGWEIFRFNLTPFFCRTSYQRALATLLRKAEYRLHKELNLAPLLFKLTECHNLVRSLATGVESPADLRAAYAPHYSNNIHISLIEEKSLLEEEAGPIPASQAFSVSAQNVQQLGEVAYKCLSEEREFYQKLDAKIEEKRRAKAKLKEDGPLSEHNKSKAPEGGEKDNTPRDKFKVMHARMTNGSVRPLIDPGESSGSDEKKRKKKDKKKSRSKSKKTADEVLGALNDDMKAKVLAKKRELESRMKYG